MIRWLLSKIVKDPPLMPAAYRFDNPKGRPLHDDWAIRGIPGWLQPWSWIPRAWTFYALPMPPHRVAGNAYAEWTQAQEGYPLAPDAKTIGVNAGLVMSMHPVHPIGHWSIQSVYVPKLRCRVPCYFTISKLIKGKRLHFNIGFKPDVTVGDNGWWFPEASLTYKEVR